MTGPRPSIWVNGARFEVEGTHVSARDRGLTLADGVFETMRVHGGTVFRLERHLARLHRALDVLAIPAPAELRNWVLDAAQSFDASHASLRLTVTRGPAAAGVAPPLDVAPTVIVAVNPMPQFPSTIYSSGLRLQVATGRRNERAETAGLKTVAYTDAIVALIRAQREGADDALFLDTEGHCSEATSSNLFVWTGDVLLTPPLSCAALPGITRATVLELAGAIGVASAERPFGPDVLLGAREAFLTSSLRGLAPVVRVDETVVGDGVPGGVTRRLAAAYAALVAEQCGTAFAP